MEDVSHIPGHRLPYPNHDIREDARAHSVSTVSDAQTMSSTDSILVGWSPSGMRSIGGCMLADAGTATANATRAATATSSNRLDMAKNPSG